MYKASNKYIYLIAFLLLVNPLNSWGVTLKIINEPVLCDISEGWGQIFLSAYQLELAGVRYQSFPGLLPEEDLIEEGHNDRQVQFRFSLFEPNDVVINPPAELQESIFQLLTQTPETFICDNTPWVGGKVTCFQLYHYLQTGKSQLTELNFKTDLESVEPEDIRTGDWVSLSDGYKDIHVMLYLTHGVYMSKFGEDKIFFHGLDAAKSIYGKRLKTKRVNSFYAWTKKVKETYRPPDPGSGACGGASTSAY